MEPGGGPGFRLRGNGGGRLLLLLFLFPFKVLIFVSRGERKVFSMFLLNSGLSEPPEFRLGAEEPDGGLPPLRAADNRQVCS